MTLSFPLLIVPDEINLTNSINIYRRYIVRSKHSPLKSVRNDRKKTFTARRNEYAKNAVEIPFLHFFFFFYPK